MQKMHALPAMILLSAIAFVIADRCAKELPCAVCIMIAGCTYYTTDTGSFCGEKKISPNLFLFKVGRVNGCMKPEWPHQIPSLTDKTDLNQTFQNKTGNQTRDSVVALGENEILTNPTVPLPIKTKRMQSKKFPEKINLKESICRQYVAIFFKLRSTRNAEKEFTRCLSKIGQLV